MSKKKREPISGLEAKYEEVRQLIAVGKERGFLAYDEINESLPDEISSSPDEIEEVFSLLEANGIAVMDADARDQLGPTASGSAPKEVAKDEKDEDGKDGVVAGPLQGDEAAGQAGPRIEGIEARSVADRQPRQASARCRPQDPAPRAQHRGPEGKGEVVPRPQPQEGSSAKDRRAARRHPVDRTGNAGVPRGH